MGKKYITFVFLLLAVILYSCEQEVSVSQPEPPPENSGKIYVNSYPDSATIFINNRNMGTTPDTIKWFEEGNYKIVLKKNLFRDTSIVIPVKKDEVSAVFVDYSTNDKMYGRVYIDSNPLNAEIFLDDSSTGLVSPTTVEKLWPGKYIITLKKTNYYPTQKEVTIRSGKEAYLSFAMVDTTYWVIYNTEYTDIPSDYIKNIQIDSNNVKWFSCELGLVSYDGENWEIFGNGNGFTGGIVNNIYIDKYNKKWISTEEGLAVYDDVSWTIYNSSNSGLPGDFIKFVGFDENDIMWVGVTGKGMVRYDGSEWRLFDADNSALDVDNINTMAFYGGTIWVGTVGAGLFKYNGTTRWQQFTKKTTGLTISPPGITIGGFPNDNVSCMLPYNNSLFLGFGTYGQNPGGSGYLNNQEEYIFSGIHSNEVKSYTEDRLGYLWASTFDIGICYFDGTSLNYINKFSAPLGTNSISNISIDNNNNKWIATFGNGIIKYKGAK